MKGEWVAKVNHINSTVTACLAENNAFIDGVLRGVIKSPEYQNHIKPQDVFINETKLKKTILPAKLSVSSYKRIVTFNAQSSYVITFERKMKGDTLAALLRNGTIQDLEDVKTILNQIKLTLQFLWSSSRVRFLHHDMHCGNIFIEEYKDKDLDSKYIPIIFDFDMSACWLQGNTNAALHFDKLYTTIFKPTFLKPYIDDLEALYTYPSTTYTDRGLVQCTPVVKHKLQLNQGNSWNWINAAYSLHANNYLVETKFHTFSRTEVNKNIFITIKDDMMKDDIMKQAETQRDFHIELNTAKCDMAMIVNSIIINCCHHNLTLLYGFLSLVNGIGFDYKLSLKETALF
jgi:hypothetical protein